MPTASTFCTQKPPHAYRSIVFFCGACWSPPHFAHENHHMFLKQLCFSAVRAGRLRILHPKTPHVFQAVDFFHGASWPPPHFFKRMPPYVCPSLDFLCCVSGQPLYFYKRMPPHVCQSFDFAPGRPGIFQLNITALLTSTSPAPCFFPWTPSGPPHFACKY